MQRKAGTKTTDEGGYTIFKSSLALHNAGRTASTEPFRAVIFGKKYTNFTLSLAWNFCVFHKIWQHCCALALHLSQQDQ